MAEQGCKTSESEPSVGTSEGGQAQSNIGRSWSLHPNPGNVDQPSLKLILNASTSSLHKLPSYEDAVKSSSEETTDGRIISTCLNTALATGELSCEQTTVIKMKTNKDTEVQLIKNTEGKGPDEYKMSNQEECEIKGSSDEGRITWDSNIDFLLSIIGFAVDLANVWRFPYLCYKNGGGAFLIPYVLMLIFGAMPLFYMEVILGQYNRQGPISLWRICPIFKGVGYCAVFIAFYVSFYYNVIIGWSLYYAANSLTLTLPWKNCNNTWNTEFCSMKCDNTSTYDCDQTRSPAKEYFNRAVLQVQDSNGINDIGTPNLKLTICVFIVYCMLYFSLFKGVKSSGKVVWITATMPYVLLFILLVRGLMLPGALDGIHFYLVPKFEQLLQKSVWVDAAIQIFYSVGAGFGVHLAYASYNKFDNNCYRDCLVTSLVNSLTSFFSGFVIFTYLGYMASYQDRPIDKVAEQGPGLVFEVYPEAIGTLPGSQVWSFLFFLTVIMLGMDSAMGGLECVITGLMDEFKSFFDRCHINREMFTGIVITVSFLVALSCVTPGGIYVFTMLETYVAGLSLLTTVFFEAIAVSWIYGLTDFKKDINKMLGHTPNLYWRVCWKYISPAFLFVIMILQMMDVGPLVIYMYDKTVYTYPAGAKAVGWILALSSILMIPLVAFVTICRKQGTIKERLLLSITPENEQKDVEKRNSRAKLKHWISL